MCIVKTTRVVGLALVLITFLGCFGCSRNIDHDGVQRVANLYHVPRERVLEVAAALNVSPADIDPNALLVFPLSHFEEQVEQFTQQNQRPPTKAEVEAMIKGYVARCDPRPNYTEYLFYSTKVHPSWINPEVAMLIAVSYAPPPLNSSPPAKTVWDPDRAPFVSFQSWNLRDLSVFPRDDPYYENCIKEYLGHGGE